jgi:predicted DNA-binding ribbon-helix-helix protein
MSITGFIAARAADLALPGSGLALGLWRRFRPLLPWLLGLIAALLVWRAPWAEARQKAADYARFQPRLDKALHAEQVALTSLQGADRALRLQSGSIRDLAAIEAARQAEAQRLIAEARRSDAARRAAAAALRASAARPVSGIPCEPSRTVKELWQ